MNRILCMCMILLSLYIPALAEDWLSIQELSEQVPKRWMQTYETKWRSIDIDAQICVPQVDLMPVVFIEGGAVAPTVSAAEIGWDRIRFDGSYRIGISRAAPSYPSQYNGMKLGTPFAEGNWYGGFSPDNKYVPLDDISFGEIVMRTEDAIRALGYNPDHFQMNDPVRIWAHHVCPYGKKNDILPGYIFIEFLPKVNGIPVLSHVQESVRGDTGTKLGDSEFWLNVPSGVTYHGYLGDLSNIRLCPLRVCQTLAEDIPLLSFDAIMAAIEGEIHAGHIRKIYEIELGYVLYNEPDRFRTAKPGKDRAAEGHTARYYARPMWQVTCLYKDTATEKLRGTPGDSDDERNTLDYYRLLIDAQTGMVIRKSNAQDRCEYKGFISWDDLAK